MLINNVNLDKMLNPNLGYKKLESIRIDFFFSNFQGQIGWQHPKNVEVVLAIEKIQSATSYHIFVWSKKN